MGDERCRIPDAGYWILDIGSWNLEFGFYLFTVLLIFNGVHECFAFVICFLNFGIFRFYSSFLILNSSLTLFPPVRLY